MGRHDAEGAETVSEKVRLDPLAEFAIFVANLGVLPDSEEARRRITLDDLIEHATRALARARERGACIQCGRPHVVSEGT